MSDWKILSSGSVIALAGRRIDADGTDPPRFPLEQVSAVRRRLAEALRQEHAMAVVCSAACGADLVALAEAERLGLRRRIVLPFPPGRFRETSVVDRPGDWGPVFDRLIEAAKIVGDLVVIGDGAYGGGSAYAAANEAIVREAQAIARPGGASRRLIALLVWEGSARSEGDAAVGFRILAESAGFEIRNLPKL